MGRKKAEENQNEVLTEGVNQDSSLDNMSIEEAFEQLQDLLNKMEADDTSLEDSFASYEQGMKLLQLCNSKIDQVERKVQIMNGDGSTDDFE